MTRVPAWAEGGARVQTYRKASATCVPTVSGHPVASVCTGMDGAGLPLAQPIVANRPGEAMLLRAAHAFEAATGHRRRLPGLRDEVRDG